MKRGVLESNGGLLNKGDLGTTGGLWKTCGPWSRGVLGKYGGPVEEDAPGIEDVLQIRAVHQTGSCLHMVTSHWRTCCIPAVGPSEGTRHGLGTWPAELDEASAFAATAAVRILMRLELGR